MSNAVRNTVCNSVSNARRTPFETTSRPDPTRPELFTYVSEELFACLFLAKHKTAWHESSPKRARKVMPCQLLEAK